VKLPHFSIATKLYAIFALLATVTVALAGVAVVNAYRHAAITEEFGGSGLGITEAALVMREVAYAGAMNAASAIQRKTVSIRESMGAPV